MTKKSYYHIATFQNISITLILIFTLIQPISSLVTIEVPSQNHKRIVCYYTFPVSQGDLEPEDIDPKLCTHILVGFATLENNSISISEEKTKIVERVIDIKRKNSNLKVMLSLGGGGGPFGFPDMVKNSSNRAKFIQSVKFIVNKLNLDGVDLDWEFPNAILNNDREHFSELLDDMRQNINNSVKKYLLSVAVAAPMTLVEICYDVPQINRLVDFINVMSYDYNFFSSLTPWTGMNAPLYARSVDVFYFATQNINYTSHYWFGKGMDKEKINIGLPVYAHTYTLRSPDAQYLGAPAIGDGKIGSGGSAKYGDVCKFLQQQNLTTVFDEETKSPYVTNGSEWISFENDLSMKYKAEFIYNNDFGGVMVFSLSSDDHAGECQNGVSFPNTRIIHKIFTQP